MSGIIGTVHAGDAPVDARLLERMTAAMEGRGPDARRVWVGAVGRPRPRVAANGPRRPAGHAALQPRRPRVDRGRRAAGRSRHARWRARRPRAVEPRGRERRRAAAARLPRLGRSVPGAPPGRFRVRRVGRTRAAAVLRARPFRRETVLLRARGRLVRLRQRSRLPPAAPVGRPPAQRAGDPRFPRRGRQRRSGDHLLRRRAAAAGGARPDVAAGRAARLAVLDAARRRSRPIPAHRRLRRAFPRAPRAVGRRPPARRTRRRADERGPRFGGRRGACPATQRGRPAGAHRRLRPPHPRRGAAIFEPGRAASRDSRSPSGGGRPRAVRMAGDQRASSRAG